MKIDAVACDEDAFGAKTEALLESIFAGEENSAVGAEDAMPRDILPAGAERPDDLAGRAGMSRRGGDVAIGRDFAFGDAADLVEHSLEHQTVLNFSSIST